MLPSGKLRVSCTGAIVSLFAWKFTRVELPREIELLLGASWNLEQHISALPLIACGVGVGQPARGRGTGPSLRLPRLACKEPQALQALS